MPKSEPAPFTFKHKGKTHRLPDPSESAMKVPGWVVQDALMNPDSYPAQTRLSLYMLEESKATAAAKAALREMDAGAMLGVIDDWMGESGRSSQSSASTGEPSSTTAEPV
jgi:hypothetical protein